MKIKKGQLLIYRVFDIGEEILLHKMEDHIKLVSKERLKFKKTVKSVIINNPPITLDLGNTILNIDGTPYPAEVTSRVWEYGSASIVFAIDISDKTIDQLTDLHIAIEATTVIDDLAKSKIAEVAKNIEPVIKTPKIWTSFEDYTLFSAQQIEGCDNLKDLSTSEEIAKLLLADKTSSLSDAMIKNTLDGAIQYSKEDIAIIDWNSGFMVEPTGNPEIRDIQEFALTHLLEIRFYDDFISDSMNYIYDQMNEKRSLFKNTFFNKSKQASSRYIEFSEFLERFENSIKVVGDPYLATVLRTSYRKFKINDWQNTVEKKMSRLAQTSELLQGEVNHQRALLLEGMIAAMILYEIIFKFF